MWRWPERAGEGPQARDTGLRGRFDYMSLNTPEHTAIKGFSVLALSEDKGTIIREAAPPAN